MNKTLNKKHLLTAASIILMVTMLMTAMASARLTTTTLNSVTNSSNVTNPSNLTGSSADGNYAEFNPTSSMLAGKMAVTPGSGATLGIYAYATTTTTIDTYWAPTSTGTWTFRGYINVPYSSSPSWRNSVGSGSPGGCQYVALYPNAGTLYGDCLRAQY